MRVKIKEENAETTFLGIDIMPRLHRK